MVNRPFVVLGILLVILNLFVLAEETPFSVETTEVSEEALATELTIIEDRAGTTPDSPLYVVDKIVENTQLALKSGEDKATYALQVKGEKVAEAALMAQANKSIETGEALTKAGELSGIIETEVSPALENLIKEEAAFSDELLIAIKKDIPTWGEINALVEKQKTQEEKIKVATEMSKKIGKYCEQVAMQDYDLMLNDENCNPDKAPEWLREKIKGEMAEKEGEAKKEMVEQITTCINDPRQCDCSKIPVAKHRNNCERNTALAIKCEYEQDMAACDELSKQPIVPEGIPSFLRPIFEQTVTELIAKKEKEMFKKFAPPECVEAGVSTREECEQIMREKYGEPPAECQKDGKFIGEKECNQIMVKIHNIPSECIKSDGGLMRQEECMQAMVQSGKIPPECVKDGKPLEPAECEAIMREKFAPQEGMGMPPECLKDGQFIGEAKCGDIMKSKFGGQMQPGQPGQIGPPMQGQPGQPMPPQEQMLPSQPQGQQPQLGLSLPPSGAYMGSGQNLVMGPQGPQLINQQELERLQQEAERRRAEGQAPPAEIEQLRQEVNRLRQEMEQLRQEVERLRQQAGQGPSGSSPEMPGQPMGPPQEQMPPGQPMPPQGQSGQEGMPPLSGLPSEQPSVSQPEPSSAAAPQSEPSPQPESPPEASSETSAPAGG